MSKAKDKILAGAAAVLVACAAFFIGWNGAKKQAQEKYKEERDYNVQLNKADLNVFDNAQGKIYVTGHKSPDSDTVGCSIGYSSLLKRLDYDAEPVLLEKINNESKYILEQMGLTVPQVTRVLEAKK